MGPLGQRGKVHLLQAPRPEGYLHPGPCTTEAVLGGVVYKRTEKASESPAKAELQVQSPVCMETSCETRQDRSWMDKSNSRCGPCDACPLQQDLKRQFAPLTGCETP